MINREPVDEHLDSQEEDDSKERFDAFFACNCENCNGVRWIAKRIEGGTGFIESPFQCECECHQKPEINIEGASWDNSL